MELDSLSGGIDFIDDWILIMLVMFCKVYCWAVFLCVLSWLFVHFLKKKMYFLLCTWQLREKEVNATVLTDPFVVSYENTGCYILNGSCTFVSYYYSINNFSAFVVLSLHFLFNLFSYPLSHFFLELSGLFSQQGLSKYQWTETPSVFIIHYVNKESNICKLKG